VTGVGPQSDWKGEKQPVEFVFDWIKGVDKLLKDHFAMLASGFVLGFICRWSLAHAQIHNGSGLEFTA
jgi:hypothetical protein